MRILHLFSIFWLSISLSANSPVLNKESITHPEVGLEGMGCNTALFSVRGWCSNFK